MQSWRCGYKAAHLRRLTYLLLCCLLGNSLLTPSPMIATSTPQPLFPPHPLVGNHVIVRQKASINKLQPVLRQLAVEEPTLAVDVIVQQQAGATDTAALVRQLGGQVRRELSIIQALAITLPASQLPALAAAPAVQQVSLDSQLYQSTTSAAEGAVVLREEFSEPPLVTTTAETGWAGLGAWSGQAWQEIGESDGAHQGDVAITRFYGGELSGLRLQGAERGLIGSVNLSDATSATLSYVYRRKDFDDAADYVTLAVSTDAGATWTPLQEWRGPATDATVQFTKVDLTPYSGHNLALRFVSSPGFDTSDKFYVDFIQVDYVAAENAAATSNLANRLFLPLVTQAGNSVAPTSGDEITFEASQHDPAALANDTVTAAEVTNIREVTDIFDTQSFNNNNGWESWAASWVETDPQTVGPTGGYVQVVNSALRLGNYPSSSGQPSAARRANLGNGVVAATLDFGFLTTPGVDSSDAIAVEVSRDGGATYTVLETLTGITGQGYFARKYDISRFASANFMVRFRVAAFYSAVDEYFDLDFVRILYERIDSGSATVLLIPAYAYDWRYLDNGSNQGTAWRQPNFNDNQWPTGRAELGYGNGSAATTVNFGPNANSKYPTTYFRRAFHVPNAANLTSLTMKIARDDGAVVYLNGTEVVRSNMPAGTINHTTYATTYMDGADENAFNSFTLPTNLLVNGRNVIAVEIHQSSGDSSDLVFNLELAGWSTCVDCINTGQLAGAHNQSIRSSSLWNNTPRLQGQGVTVAVVDSGIALHGDNDSSMLSERVLAQVNFVSAQSSVDDLNGHGSHIAGIIAGNGVQSGGAYLGVAPRANLVDVRVTDDQGRGSLSDVVAGLQWVFQNKANYNIRVVNLSLNSTVAQSYHSSPLNAALEILWFNGIVVVVSAGNNGSSASGILYPPANDPFVITVGAVDDRGTTALTDDTIPAFSAFGTTGDGFAKPDLVAPGRNITSLLASDDSNLALNHPNNKVTASSGKTYFRMSGTSMASAVVAGAVALLLQDEPNLTPDQVKHRLKATANKSWSGYTAAKAGAGYLDIHAAVTGTTTQSANTGINASQLLWTGSQPVTWNSVSWNSVSWNSVSWNSVSWNSVSWNSLNWGSDYWE